MKKTPDPDTRKTKLFSTNVDCITTRRGTTIPVLYFIFNLLLWRISWPGALCNLVDGQMAQSQCQSDPLDWDTGGGEFSGARQPPLQDQHALLRGGSLSFHLCFVQTAVTLGTLADTERN